MQLPLALLSLLANPSADILADVPGVQPIIEVVQTAFRGDSTGARPASDDETKKPKPKPNPKPKPKPPPPPPSPDPCPACGMG